MCATICIQRVLQRGLETNLIYEELGVPDNRIRVTEMAQQLITKR